MASVWWWTKLKSQRKRTPLYVVREEDLQKEIKRLKEEVSTAKSDIRDWKASCELAQAQRDEAREAALYLFRAAVMQKEDLLDTLRDSKAGYRWLVVEQDKLNDAANNAEEMEDSADGK